MTIEQAMVHIVEQYLLTFAVVAGFSLAVGVLIGYWVAKDHVSRTKQAPTGDVMDVAYSVGVAKARHPFGERCRHGVQFLDECLDCPDGCPQVVA